MVRSRPAVHCGSRWRSPERSRPRARRPSGWPIIAGTTDTGDPAIVELFAIQKTSLAKCTATLVSPALARAQAAPVAWCGSDEVGTNRVPDLEVAAQEQVVDTAWAEGLERAAVARGRALGVKAVEAVQVATQEQVVDTAVVED